MVIDYVQVFKLEKAKNQQYVKIKREYYANFTDRILVIGRKVSQNYSNNTEVVEKNIVAYVYEFDLHNMDIKQVNRDIKIIEENPKFYKTYWKNIVQHFIEFPYRKQYCPIVSFYPNSKTKELQAEDLIKYIKEKKMELKVINTDIIKEALTNMVSMMPIITSEETIKKDNTIHNMLSFIDSYDCLLLSTEQKTRDIYLKYKEREEIFWCSKVAMIR